MCIVVNITGALFAISPTFLACLAVIVGIVWPSWVSEFWLRLQEFTEETRARGRGDDYYSQSSTTTNSGGSGNSINTARLLGRYDKNKYHFYKRSDGTKQFYRTGQSLFSVPKRKDKDDSNAIWPWNKEKKTVRKPVNPWGALGSLVKDKNNN